MKKFLDRYLFSKLGLQIVFSVVTILLFSFIGSKIRAYVTNHKSQDVYSQTFWGFRQITDGGSVAGTLDELDSVAEESGNDYGAPVVLVIALASWLIGMVLYSFVTGAVVNAFEGRKDKIEGGKARYRFKDHGIVIGWDFQGVASVMALLDVWGLKEVLVVSETPRISGLNWRTSWTTSRCGRCTSTTARLAPTRTSMSSIPTRRRS